ncbi:MAG: ATP-binding protein [Bacteroidota bacterium]
MAHKTYFSWSSGKDAALAFYHLSQDSQFRIDRLLTSVNDHHQRVSMHGLRIAMLEAQAQALGLPLQLLRLPEQPTMAEYDTLMDSTLANLQQAGYTHAGFGDIFLEDLKTYRDQQLQAHQIQGVYPLWKRNTTELVRELIDRGFKCVVICLKSALLSEDFLGREIDESFLQDLPPTVDPCGENGEFHTFCYDGPIFQHPVSFQLGERVYREYRNPDPDQEIGMGFWFCDVLPG